MTGKRQGVTTSAVVALLLVGACSNPGFSYNARVPAGDLQAARYRTVSVGHFSGPEGRWYTNAFESMLLSAQFDGAPWFIVHDPQAPKGTYGGRYSGVIDIADISVREYTKTRKECVEWDGLFDCEHRAEVLKACVDVDVEVSVTARLTDVPAGEIIFQDHYLGRASDHECDDVAIVSGKYAKKNRKGFGWFGQVFDRFGHQSDYLTEDLVYEALRDTLDDVRRDIAPFNARAKAPLVAEAIDPEVRADLRFTQAIAAAESGNRVISCELFGDLLASYPTAPAVAHNVGACAEASGDLARAQGHYAAAVEGMAFFRRDNQAYEVLLGARERIDAVRAGDSVLSQLTDEFRVHDGDLPSTTMCPDCITSEGESVEPSNNPSNDEEETL